MVRGLSQKDIKECLYESKRWLESIYGLELRNNKKWKDFGLDKIHFSKTSRRGGFYRKGIPRGHKDKMIWIGLKMLNLTH